MGRKKESKKRLQNRTRKICVPDPSTMRFKVDPVSANRSQGLPRNGLEIHLHSDNVLSRTERQRLLGR